MLHLHILVQTSFHVYNTYENEREYRNVENNQNWTQKATQCNDSLTAMFALELSFLVGRNWASHRVTAGWPFLRKKGLLSCTLFMIALTHNFHDIDVDWLIMLKLAFCYLRQGYKHNSKLHNFFNLLWIKKFMKYHSRRVSYDYKSIGQLWEKIFIISPSSGESKSLGRIKYKLLFSGLFTNLGRNGILWKSHYRSTLTMWNFDRVVKEPFYS